MDTEIDHIIRWLYSISDRLAAYRAIMETGKNCNACGKRNTCEYIPGWGQQIRYNCPLWEEPDEEASHGDH